MPETTSTARVVVGRRLTAEQSDRRQQLIAAARALATAGGYDAVTISALCERAGVARATFYHYFGSKDHVLGEAVVQWGYERMQDLRREPPAGRTALQRVVATLRRVMQAVEREPHLIGALVQSMVSSDLGVGHTQRQLASLVAGYLEASLGPAVGFNLPEVSMILSHVFFSVLVNLSAGRTNTETVMAELTTTARYLLEPRQTGSSAEDHAPARQPQPPRPRRRPTLQMRSGRRTQ